MEIPETRYAKTSDGAYLAYQVFGSGPIDLLYVPGWVTHLEVYWEHPLPVRFLRRLGSMARVIWFDKRGSGLSDRVTAFPDLETMVDDVKAVLDAAGSARTVLWGDGPDGGGACAVFAASHPDRTHSFIWWQATARYLWAPDYPWGYREEDDPYAIDDDEFLSLWGKEQGADRILRMVGCHSMADDQDARRWIAKFYRYAATPGSAAEFERTYTSIDVRGVLTSIQIPTLVVERFDGAQEEGEYIASRIAGSQLARLPPSEDFPPFLGDQEDVFRTVGSFLNTVREDEAELDRVLATVLFTDIVDSTSTAAVMGDAKWRALVDQHDRIAKGLIGRYRGEYRKSTGDGLMATFDGPARAVRCAQAFVEAVKPLGIEVRTGTHTGEITFGENDLAGIGVHVAARVAGLAGTSEVWASSTVKDLTAGSGLTFEDAGEHELKGVPDTWHLYRVTS